MLVLGIEAGPSARPLRTGRRTAPDTAAAPLMLVRPARDAVVRSRGRRRPTVVVQPRSVVVSAGRVAGFTAAASGQPAPRPQWQRSRNGGRTWTDIPGAHQVTFTFTAQRSQSGAEYRAVFSSAAGRVSTRAARLTVRGARAPGSGSTTPPNGGGGTGTGSGGDTGGGTGTGSGTGSGGGTGTGSGGGTGGGTGGSAPQVITQPGDQSVQSGQPAAFVTVAGGVVTSVQWQVSTDAGADWSNVPYATAMSYSFVATAGDNGYEYRAVLTNASGTTITRAATLTVTVPAGDAAPQVTTQPTSQTVLSGNSATFTAAASGTPTPTTQWQVSTNGGQWWSTIINATSTSYTVRPSSGQTGYEYRAVFTNGAGTVATNPASLVVAAGSNNWSGYAALDQGFRSVTGSWQVPAVTCPGTATTYSSQWIGIDGAQDGTVEQDGTESDCIDGVPTYDAWYEMYGDPAVNNGAEVEISPSIDRVSPGDAMTASVGLTGSTWTLAISDTTAGWQYSIPIASPSPAPQQSSAEWIVERPGVNGSLSSLADFGTAAFTGAAATDAAASGPISAFNYLPIEMDDSNNAVLATPGPLGSGGAGFTATWNASS